MIIPERTETSKEPEDEGIDIDRVMLQEELRAMLKGVYGVFGRRKRRVVSPGSLTTQFESVHDEE